MPLRDHFHPPVNRKHSWDELHGGWPMTMVQHLFRILPEGYAAAPGVHLGLAFEIDIAAFEPNEPAADEPEPAGQGNGGVAVATWAPPKPTLRLETELRDQDEYEVRVYDDRFGRRLVAAVEIVSPSNKDRPESRRAFVAKCAAFLQRDVCVSIVDLVTVRSFNLYGDLLALFGGSDPRLGAEAPTIYAATIRGRQSVRRRLTLDAWFYPLTVGQPLPTLPLWLDIGLAVPPRAGNQLRRRLPGGAHFVNRRAMTESMSSSVDLPSDVLTLMNGQAGSFFIVSAHKWRHRELIHCQFSISLFFAYWPVSDAFGAACTNIARTVAIGK